MLALLALLSAAGSFAPARAAAAATAGSCTLDSFAAPSWLVQEVQLAKPALLSFRLVNRATSAAADLACPASPGGAWTSCAPSGKTPAADALQASVSLDNGMASVLVNETWACSDMTPGKPIIFSAVGNTTIALDGSSVAPVLIRASLVAPVRVSPAAEDGPVGHDTPGCAAASKTPAWELQASQIVRRTEVGANGTVQVSGNAYVAVTNLATGATAGCLGNTVNYPELQILDCEVQGPYRPHQAHTIQTSMLFDPATFALTMNETWFCDDVSPAVPLTITGTASTKLPLTCSDFDHEPSEPTITFCTNTGDPIDFPGKQVSESALAPYALTDAAVSTASSCTAASAVAPAWRLSDFETTISLAGASSTGVGALALRVALASAPPDSADYPTATVRAQNVHLSPPAPGTWYPCVLAGGSSSEAVLQACSLQYDMAARTLVLNATWHCSDLDSAHPVVFTGIANTTLPDYTCTTETTANRIRCATPKGTSWVATVNSTTIVQS
ncbi:hypothetical protein B0T24DRAFT_718166 [Lasiosphaeria ovina]|uniref:Uncharacterized protein n=1 Tax=Lasiosphaeria ovina TaxID=92902 RepID=A0AAE0N9W4_9PEZI|nr:hypothetical protein B0T24DRAFT_718166 [Lasiosphaeria ovina]